MSKTKNNELKFSIRSLIDTNSGENSQTNGVRHPPSNRSLKRLVTEPPTPFIRRPIPLINPKVPHPCWSFLTQLTNKANNGAFPLHSSLIFLNKMSQVWEQMQQTQISPSIPTENDDVSEEDTSSIHHDVEIEDEEEEEEEEDDDDEDDDADAGECSSSGGDKLNPSTNSEENDKLKTYPCAHCGKVRSFQSTIKDRFSSLVLDLHSTVQSRSTYASTYWYSAICLQSKGLVSLHLIEFSSGMWKRFSTSIDSLSA